MLRKRFHVTTVLDVSSAKYESHNTTGDMYVTAERNRQEPMLLETINLKQTHLELRDVDDTEVSLTLDDTIDLYQFVKDHLQKIAKKKKGDLLEKIAKELLETHNYEVETQIRNTGVELDLLCQNKANRSKKIYVECKAYGEDNKVQSEVITSLHGIRGIKNYEEAWLISW